MGKISQEIKKEKNLMFVYYLYQKKSDQFQFSMAFSALYLSLWAIIFTIIIFGSLFRSLFQFLFQTIYQQQYLIMITNQEFQNKRDDQKLTNSKSIKNQPQIAQEMDLKEIYLCSCGKQYLSFPATYLHFRSKHNIKLSTKLTESRRIVQIEGQIKKITYRVSENSQENIQQNSKDQNQESINQESNLSQQMKIINSCIQKYVKSSRHSSKILYQKLVEFLNMISTKENHKLGPVMLEKIPYFLNDFMLFYLPACLEQIQIGNQKWKQSCVELSRFCNWLRKEKYTELILLYQRE